MPADCKVAGTLRVPSAALPKDAPFAALRTAFGECLLLFLTLQLLPPFQHRIENPRPAVIIGVLPPRPAWSSQMPRFAFPALALILTLGLAPAIRAADEPKAEAAQSAPVE